MENFPFTGFLVLWFLITGLYILFWVIGNSIRDRPVEWGNVDYRYAAPSFFILVGIVCLLIGLGSAVLGDSFVIRSGVMNFQVEHSITAGFALYGAGIAVMLFGADLMLKIRTDIESEQTFKKLSNDIEEIKQMLMKN